jgi:hypothetical protein
MRIRTPQPPAPRVCPAGCLVWPAAPPTAPKKEVHDLYYWCTQAIYAGKVEGPPTQECSCHSTHDMLPPFAGPPNRLVAAGVWHHAHGVHTVAWQWCGTYSGRAISAQPEQNMQPMVHAAGPSNTLCGQHSLKHKARTPRPTGSASMVAALKRSNAKHHQAGALAHQSRNSFVCQGNNLVNMRHASHPLSNHASANHASCHPVSHQ